MPYLTPRQELLSFWEQQEKPRPLPLYTQRDIDAAFRDGVIQGRGDFWCVAVGGLLAGMAIAGTFCGWLSL